MTPQLHEPDPATLALAGERLSLAMAQSDMVQVLVAAADLDRMARSLGPLARTDGDRTALIRAHDLVGSVLTRLQAEMARSQTDHRRDQRLRLAYSGPT
jgi:hypothetical protein